MLYFLVSSFVGILPFICNSLPSYTFPKSAWPKVLKSNVTSS